MKKREILNYLGETLIYAATLMFYIGNIAIAILLNYFENSASVWVIPIAISISIGSFIAASDIKEDPSHKNGNFNASKKSDALAIAEFITALCLLIGFITFLASPFQSKKIENTTTPTPTTIQKNTSRKGAICNDGTRSYSTGQGACSHHGGVQRWL